jgi:hypothetical protein
MSAENIGHLLRGQKVGRMWLCPCPVPTHGKGRGDRNPSLLVSDRPDGSVRFSCRAGCSSAEVADYIRDLDSGALQREGERYTAKDEIADKAKKLGWAKRIWDRTVNARGTLVERYLRSRKLTQLAQLEGGFCNFS